MFAMLLYNLLCEMWNKHELDDHFRPTSSSKPNQYLGHCDSSIGGENEVKYKVCICKMSFADVKLIFVIILSITVHFFSQSLDERYP
jgi:hypothetical protein